MNSKLLAGTGMLALEVSGIGAWFIVKSINVDMIPTLIGIGAFLLFNIAAIILVFSGLLSKE